MIDARSADTHAEWDDERRLRRVVLIERRRLRARRRPVPLETLLRVPARPGSTPRLGRGPGRA
jgi:hypothetical protein